MSTQSGGGIDRLQRQQDAQHMRSLLESEAFVCYQRHLEQEMASALTRVLDVPASEMEAARAFWRGLRQAQIIPHRVIALGKEPN